MKKYQLTFEEYKTLCKSIMDHFPVFMKDLDFRLRDFDQKYQGCCPIHIGDNKLACSIYKDGFSMSGWWECRTHHCHQLFQPTAIGFIRGVLSNKKYGWRGNKDQKYGFQSTLQYVIEKTKWSKEAHPELLRKIKEEVLPKKEVVKFKIKREDVRKTLKIPSKYYLDRGLSSTILDKYDVGDCLNPKKELYNRAVIPLYNDEYTLAENFLGRRLNDSQYMSKWTTTGDINPRLWLFNSWFRQGNDVVLVESIGNALKLLQAGIPNVCALFGNCITKEQILKLQGEVKNVTLILDNDEGGRIGNMLIPKKMTGFNVKIPRIEYNGKNDIFEFTNSEIEMVKGLL